MGRYIERKQIVGFKSDILYNWSNFIGLDNRFEHTRQFWARHYELYITAPKWTLTFVANIYTYKKEQKKKDGNNFLTSLVPIPNFSTLKITSLGPLLTTEQQLRLVENLRTIMSCVFLIAFSSKPSHLPLRKRTF